MLTRLIFTLTLFASAFLSFAIQPILGKMLLPIIGGATAGWIVTMAFFQLALLGGYALSHLLRRTTPIQHGLVLLGVYLLGLCVLPAEITTQADLTQSMALNVLGLLATTILLPFIALTATTSALLRLFSQTDQPTAHDPYYLFTASNIGSLLGLFIYPLALEPFWTLHDLSRLWLVLYGCVIAGIVGALGLTRRSSKIYAASSASPATASPIPFKTIAGWFCLAFIPCSLSMSLTTMISTDMGNFPLIWTLPLGAYLLSFVFGFARRPKISLDKLHFLHIIASALLFIFLMLHLSDMGMRLYDLIGNLICLLALVFCLCWSCHQTLAAQRPATDRLTFYYLVIAIGGAVAGLINAIILPLTVNVMVEFPVTIILSLCLPMIWHKKILPQTFRYQTFIWAALPIMVGIIMLAFNKTRFITTPDIRNTIQILNGVFMVCTFALIFKPRYLILLMIFTTCYLATGQAKGKILLQHRNFFGIATVAETHGSNFVLRSLRHGNTIHGIALYNQYHEPTGALNLSYYSPDMPLRDAVDILQPQHIAVLGLGAGQLACFPSHAKTTYFEIDPDMVEIATNEFPYLKQCPPEQIVVGDARIEFAKQTQKYDVLVLDVFSSDGIPVHILTQDAIAMYVQHLNPHGVMMFHISNRYLSLAPQIAASAKTLNLTAYAKLHVPDKATSPFALASQWVAVPLDAAQHPEWVKQGWQSVDPGMTQLWTDQKSSLLMAIRPIARHYSPTPDLLPQN